MKISRPFLVSRLSGLLGMIVFLALGTVSGRAAATLSQHITPTEANVGDQVTVAIEIKNGSADITLPSVNGLQVLGQRSAMNMVINNGALSSSVEQIFTIMPVRAGDFTIPAFDVHLADGQALHVQAMKLHVVNGGAPTAPAAPAGSSQPNPGFGPVVIPPMNAGPPEDTDNTNPPDLPGSNINPPTDSDGRPAKVFMLITPKTTDAYVGESIPVEIQFFIRMDVIAQQDSLPTINGTNFLMNDLSVRPAEDELMLKDEPYHRETWYTAISAPKSGDFPLQMERDTYWTKSSQSVFSDPLGSLFGQRPALAHENISGNQLVIHVHPLPEEGQPANFSGAIGQFRVAGNESPATANIGDPVYLDFTVSGEGNFDRVRCPTLTPDPAWKTYVPSSKTNYVDESHTQGDKTFRQALIAQRNGNLPLPDASFSYFDPGVKKYVTVPIKLPVVAVTGNMVPTVAAASSSEVNPPVTPAVVGPAAFMPNRLEFGSLSAGLTPAYRQVWFWTSQGAALAFLFLGGGALFLRSRRRSDLIAAQRLSRQRSLRELETAMNDAVARGDAVAFFPAARQAVQIQLGAQWNLLPENVTFAQIQELDPPLAEELKPLFDLADDVMYSGRPPGGIDLADWDRRVREELLHLQPA